MPKQRRNIALSLSFLDIMACGFGAVTLLFLIFRHNASDIQQPDAKAAAELAMLQQDIEVAEERRAAVLNSLEKLLRELTEAQGLSRRVVTELNEVERSLQSDPQDNIEQLRRQVEELERETAALEDIEYGDKVREFVGDGNRQYLTGLKLGGERVLILVDGSASMLADNLVNVIRRRNMSAEQRRQAPKWQWTLNTVDWLLAQLPVSSRFQVYIFNTAASAAIVDSEGDWLDAADSLAIERAVEGLAAYAPEAGTSLQNAFAAIDDFDQLPDNIFLLTDGLPTQGAQAPRTLMVTAQQRRELFLDARAAFPAGVPINTILFPMEGDPEAAALYWQLALSSQGAFIAPSRDWP
ncbi:MAG: VWA domain-containing protein [Porticoccaceae bacterium]|nr:VWA domain-containing protein [Porticoccaceae bacterium]